MNISFTVSGKPVGKERPRFTRNGHTYTPAKTRAAEEAVQWAYKAKYGETKFEKGIPIRIEILSFFQIPKSDSKAIKELKIQGGIKPTKKPDVDNIAKLICDALNGIAYDDDSQIVELYIKKCYTKCAPESLVSIAEADWRGQTAKGG